MDNNAGTRWERSAQKTQPPTMRILRDGQAKWLGIQEVTLLKQEVIFLKQGVYYTKRFEQLTSMYEDAIIGDLGEGKKIYKCVIN